MKTQATYSRFWIRLVIVMVIILISTFIGLWGILYQNAASASLKQTIYKIDNSISNPFVVKEFGQPMSAYALIARSDNTVRRALVSSFAIEAVRAQQPVPIGTIFIIEVREANGKFGFVDVRQKLANSWSYGRFSPNAVDFTTRKAPQECDQCHAQSGPAGPPFTNHLLEQFVRSGVIQKVRCDLAERDPCLP